MRVAFLGLGRMGSAMARHVVEAGHELTVWNRTPGRAGDLVDAGAKEADSVRTAVADADTVVLMLVGADSVREVLDQVLDAAPQGALIIDATTIGRDAAQEFSARAVDRGLRYVDAPVVGTTGPAAEGTLGVLVGGSESDVAEAKQLLTTWGAEEKVRHIGEVGSANALKTVVNLCLGVAMAGVGEALRLGHDLGIDREDLIGTLAQGPFGFSVGQKREMLSSGEYTPTAFSLELMLKDLQIALDVATHDLPLVAAAARYAEEAISAGHGSDDYASMAGYLANEGSANSY